MIFRIPALCLLLLTFLSCVPKAQYDTLVTERDYYRSQVVETDSSTSRQLRVAEDSLTQMRSAQRQQARRMEELLAANRSLNGRITDLTDRYESILEQNRLLVGTNTSDGNLQQRLLDRQAELERREAELERRSLQLRAREESLSSLDRMREEQPQTYGSSLEARGTSPVDPESSGRMQLASLQEELRQLMLALSDTGYVLRSTEEGKLELVLGGELTFTEGDSLSFEGQRILRRLGATLRNYAGLQYTIVGHAESVDGDALLAYQSSTKRAIRMATELARYGIDPGTILAGGQGFYGTDDTPQLNGLDAERRTTLLIRAAN